MTQETALEILKSGRNVFLTGEPGAGKTYTINKFTEWLEDGGITFAVTASTGIAASHIDGSTIHSWCGIGIMKDLDEADVNGIRFNKFHYQRIVAAEVLILDEVSMLDATFINDLDKILKAVHKSSAPFGGIQVVMVGDFFQLPPVSRDRALQFAFESTAWEAADFQVCYLTEQHRQAEPIFTDLLRAMRFGSLTQDHINIIQSRLNSTVDTKVNLFTHNVDVDSMNAVQLQQLPGEQKTYRMEEEGHPFAVAALKRNCITPERLDLKEGAVVMFTANKPDHGYVNGTVGIVERFSGGPVIKLIDSGRTVYPEKYSWKAYNENRVVKASITQYPIRLAWAITVHKSQGMSLDMAKMDLSKAFEFGHGYVAISRVRSLSGLFLSGISDTAYRVNPKVLEQDKIFREKGV